MKKSNSKKQSAIVSAQTETVTAETVTESVNVSRVERLLSLFVSFIVSYVLSMKENLRDGLLLEKVQFSLLKEFAIREEVTFTNKVQGMFGKNVFPIFANLVNTLDHKESGNFYTKLNSLVVEVMENGQTLGYVVSVKRQGLVFFFDAIKNRDERLVTFKRLNVQTKETAIEEKGENGETVTVTIATDAEVETLKADALNLTAETETEML